MSDGIDTEKASVASIIINSIVGCIILLALIIICFRFGLENKSEAFSGVKAVSGLSWSSIDFAQVVTFLFPAFLQTWKTYFQRT